MARIGNFTAGMRQASSSAEREMGRVQNSVVTVDSLIKKLAVTAGTAFSVAQIVGYADSYTGMVNKLKLVTSTQSELSRAMDDTHKIAQATASDWNGVLDVYTKFQGLSKRLGIDQAEVARITETVTKTVSMSGQSAAASEAALLQFGQALSTGLLRGAELTSVMSQAPALAEALAEGMGVAVGDLKKLGEEGKITSEKMRDALLKMSSSIDAEYAKTATTVAASFNLIKNETIKIVGEFDSATGASKTFVQGMTLLYENMGTVTNTMMISATFMAGTYIPVIYGAITAGYARTKQMVEQTAIQYAAINAERAAAASSLAQAQAQLVNTQSTLAALAAEKALEVQRLQAQINAIGRMASTTRMAQLRQIEVQVTAELTAAETALAAARARSTAAAATSVGVGRAAIGILSGPVGMGITLAAVAAGYLLMKDGADKATSSIDIQGQSVADLVKKYRELNTLQRDNETKALAEQVQDLAVKFRVASSDLSSFMQALPASDEKIDFFVKLTKEYQNGKISSDAYYKAVKDVNFLTDEQLDKVRSLVGRYGEAKGKFNAAEVAQDALSKAMTGTTQKAKEQAAQVAGLSEEIKKLLGANAEGANKSNYLKEMVNLKVDPKLAEMLYEARKAEGLEWGKNQVLSDAVRKSVFDRWKADQGLNKTLEERAKIEERNKKAIEAQGAAMKVNALVASNAAKYNFSGKESKYGLPTGTLSALMMNESRGDGRVTGPMTDWGRAKGGFQLVDATAKRFNVKDPYNIEQAAEGASKYMQYLLKKYEGNLENSVRAYHAGEGNVDKGKGIGPINNKYWKDFQGYMGGASGVSFTDQYSYDDYIKEIDQYLIKREKLEVESAARQKEITLNVSTEEFRIRSKLADDIENITKSRFDGAETKRLIAEYQKRADIDIQIAQASHDDKLSIYSDYLKTEETLTSESFARRQRDLILDLTLSADEYTAASLALENQRKKEIESLRRDEKFEVLEAKRDWMDKGEYAQQYYALIREEILNTASYSPEIKDARIKEANFNQGLDQNAERENVWGDYKSMMGLDESPYQQDMDLLAEARAQMLITEEQYQQQRLGLQMSYGSQYGADFAGMMMGLVDSSSSAYAILGGIQKGAALFSTAMNSYAAISAAWASAPFPYNLPAVGMATMETGLLQAAVSALSPVGFADGGFTGYGGKYEQAGIVHKGEGVLTQEEIAALGGPAGFYALRESIKNGFSDGGLVLDAPKILNPNQNKDLTNYLSQAQSNNNQAANVNLNPNFVIVDERQSLGDYLYGPDGKKAFVKFFKQNRRELGLA